MKRTLYISLVALLAAIGTQSLLISQDDMGGLRKLEDNHKAIYEKIKKATVMVRCNVPSGPRQGGYYGTGVLISSDGYVLTCTSVIPANAGNVDITLPSGETKDGDIIGASLQYEVTLVKISGNNYPYIERGDSSSIEVGDRVYSAGNAFQLGSSQRKLSYSTGIVSGLYHTQSVYWQSQYKGLIIESDSAINPGADGGPIVNYSGELVGLITLSADRARWLGMGTPSSLFNSYLNAILAKEKEKEEGKNRKPYLGVEFQETEDDNLKVTSVVKHAPCWEAGLRVGDIVYEANGKELETLKDFDSVMKKTNPGDTIMLYIDRGDQQWATIVQVGFEPM